MHDVTHDELVAEAEVRAERYAEAWPSGEGEERVERYAEARSYGEGEGRAERLDGLYAAVEAEEREWLSTDDIHPYKSRVPQTKGKTVSFPKITKFSTYLRSHYGEEIVDEINGMLYDGELAAICGVDGFCSQRLPHEHCRIDPRMTFWRVNKYEFTADLVVYLKARVYDAEGENDAGGVFHADGNYDEDALHRDDNSLLQTFTLYVSLDFCIDDRITYKFCGISLRQPERDQMKLDDYLIPIMSLQAMVTARRCIRALTSTARRSTFPSSKRRS